MSVWAVPGNRYICLLSLQGHRGVGVTCDRTSNVLHHGLATTLLDEQGQGIFVTGRRVIVGIAPDQTRDVIAEGPESAVEIPVVGGGFTWRDRSTYPPERLKLMKRVH